MGNMLQQLAVILGPQQVFCEFHLDYTALPICLGQVTSTAGKTCLEPCPELCVSVELIGVQAKLHVEYQVSIRKIRWSVSITA